MDWLTLSLKLADSVFTFLDKKLPDWAKKKKVEYFELKKKYLEAVSVEPHMRDDNLIVHRAHQLKLFFEVFNEEINAKSVDPAAK
jgi:hypothetical protein